jgi:hypothetical protein
MKILAAIHYGADLQFLAGLAMTSGFFLGKLSMSSILCWYTVSPLGGIVWAILGL